MKLFTPLTREELERLQDLARVERRHVRDQAATLIAEGLQRRGLLKTERLAATPPPEPSHLRAGDDV